MVVPVIDLNSAVDRGGEGGAKIVQQRSFSGALDGKWSVRLCHSIVGRLVPKSPVRLHRFS